MVGDRTSAVPIERLLAYCILIFGSGVFYAGFTPIVGGAIAARAGDSILYQGIWLFLYLLLAVSVVIRFNMIYSLLVNNVLVSLLMIVYLASEVANAGINGAVIPFILLCLTIVFSAWFSCIFSLSDMVTLFCRLFFFIILAHIIILLVIGTPYNADDLDRFTVLGTIAQSGLFPHKNHAGIVFAIAAILFVSHYFYSPTRPLLSLAGAITSVVLLLLGGAAGAIVVTLAGLGVIVGFLALKFRNFILLVCASIGLLAMSILMFSDEDLFLHLLGRTSTLTGRTIIWSWWPFFFSEHPWLGLGYGGFFVPNGPAERLWDMLPNKYTAANFHNSFLDVGIQTGIFGMSLMILIVIVGLYRSSLIAFYVKRMYTIVPLAFFVPFVLYATIESDIPAHNNFATMMFFIMYFKSSDLYKMHHLGISLLSRSGPRRLKLINAGGVARTTRNLHALDAKDQSSVDDYKS